MSYDSFPSGNPQRITFGDEATASFTYHDDGAVRSLDYDVPTLGSIRSHSNMTYDHRGLLTSEQVSVATVTPGADTGGTAGFSYDLAGRLKSWTSPFRLVSSMPTTDNPVTTYSLDDASNITSEQVTVGSEVRRSTTASFVNARLETHATDTSDVAAAGTDTATDTTFDYLPIGDESRRDSTTTTTSLTGGSTFSHSRASSYDAAGRPDAIDNSGTAPPPDVDYLYDVSGRLLARTSGSDTRYFFYFATGSRYAQETDPSGTVITRYLNAPRGGVLAEQRVGSGAWVWLLKDPQSNVATELRQGQVAPQVIGHRAYDPYGATYDGGTQTAVGEQASKLGYQSARRDEDTGYLLIGPRLYDPDTDRFTSADFYVGAASDMSLGTDPLTGNRYLLAAANPVAFDDDGHRPTCEGSPSCSKNMNGQVAEGLRDLRERQLDFYSDLFDFFPNPDALAHALVYPRHIELSPATMKSRSASLCFFVCGSVSFPGGISFGVTNVGKGQGLRVGFGFSYLESEGTELPADGVQLIECFILCTGAYRNSDGSSGNFSGFGSLGVFVGPSWTPSEETCVSRGDCWAPWFPRVFDEYKPPLA